MNNIEEFQKQTEVYLKSDDYIISIQLIGSDFDLHLSNISELDKIVRRLASGQISGDDFEAEVKSNMDIPDEDISKLAKVVDEKIMKPLKANLVKISEGVHNETKDSILSEIENPTPSIKTPVVNTTSLPIIKPSVPVAEALKVETNLNVPLNPADLINQKLQTSVNMPTEQIVITEALKVAPIPTPAEKISTKIDPYRELPEA